MDSKNGRHRTQLMKTWATKGKGDIRLLRTEEGKPGTGHTGLPSGHCNRDTVSQNRTDLIVRAQGILAETLQRARSGARVWD